MAAMSGLEAEAEDNTIEVTPTDSIEGTADATAVDDQSGAEYVLYGGKGGVGKTTMAAATALDSARRGISTLVVSTDPAHSLSDTYGVDVPPEPEQVLGDIPLYAAEIDPEVAIEEGQAAVAADADPMGGMGDLLGGEEEPLGGAVPGADEAAAMQLLLEYLDDDRFELVVVDTAPTGHTLRLLELPELLDTMVGRVLRFRQRLGGMVEGLKGMFGEDQPDSTNDLEDLEVLRERIERLRIALSNPERTDFRIVMVPEEMSVRESVRLRDQLEDYGIPVGTVVVNRVMEPLAAVAEAHSTEDASVPEPNLEDCAFCQRRWDVQQGALTSAQELFRGTTVRRVPLFADEVRGEEMLTVVADCLR